MFTGIVEEIGTVAEVKSLGGGIRFRISAPLYAPELNVNDSISINGACHTVVSKNNDSFDVESVEETLKKTSLGKLTVGSSVNLEMPMQLNERLGGHLVLGHVDCTGTITGIEKRETSIMFAIEFPREFVKYVIQVGSISIDGVSLTIAELEGNSLRVSIIPHTIEKTIFRRYEIGTIVNIEFDLIGKYIEKIIAGNRNPMNGTSMLSEEYLKEQGF